MPRFSLLSFFYFVAGCTGYFALIAIARRDESSLVARLVESLGLYYGTLLYTSGFVAFYVSCRSAWRSTRPSEVAIALPFAFLPAFIGLIALVHGYIIIFEIIGNSTTGPNPWGLYLAYATALMCLLPGLSLSFISFAILSIAMLVKSVKPKSGDELPASNG